MQTKVVYSSYFNQVRHLSVHFKIKRLCTLHKKPACLSEIPQIPQALPLCCHVTTEVSKINKWAKTLQTWHQKKLLWFLLRCMHFNFAAVESLML